MIDKETGEFEGVNRFVKKASHGEVERCSLYSIMEHPMTCCGCFECIALMLPEVNGIMVVNREYKGETPSGMSFLHACRDNRGRGPDTGIRRDFKKLYPFRPVSAGRRRN